jgi:hypothetical protein
VCHLLAHAVIMIVRPDVIRDSDSELINSKWTYSSATSLATIKDCIRGRPTVCIRKRNVHHLMGLPSRALDDHRPLVLCRRTGPVMSPLRGVSCESMGRWG